MPYALLGTVVGAVADAAPERGPAMLFGGGVCLGLSVACLSPAAPGMDTWTWQMAALLAASGATSCLIVPVLTVLENTLEAEARERSELPCSHDDILSFGFVFLNMGELVGPLAGSYFAGTFGSSASYRVLGLVVAAVSLLSALLLASSGSRLRGGQLNEEGASEPMLRPGRQRLAETSPMHAVHHNACLLRAVSETSPGGGGSLE
ncbi:unnamed protein product [Prorocentrum cordatum]|uniref:Major facilitator superfamily (MFS) profile domain-containing protein n=1 Tax=Prorocentrum cordatum TaxID=2364126 RepID=A0ABN9TSG8_9DINO|nr:unnamed protein product [Polarella glacialis]